MREQKVRAHPYHYRKQLHGARGLIVAMHRELAQAEDVIAACMYDYDMLKATMDREIATRDAQIVALRRMVAEARGEVWMNR